MSELLRVLQVEDSESDAGLIARLLEKAGWRVDSERIEDARGMREALARSSWDVIVADYRLPGFDAPGALRILRESGHDIPFIVVSGAIGEDLAVEIMRAGAHDYLMKGSLARLAPAIQREIGEACTRKQRRQAIAALCESEERFRAFMDGGPVIAWAKDEQGHYVYVNVPCERRFNMSLEDWHGKTDFDLWPSDIAQRFRTNDQQVLASYSTTDLVETIPNHDGQPAHWWNFRFPFRDAAGRTYVGGIGVDITNERRLESELRESQARLRLAQESAGIVSWDWEVRDGWIAKSTGGTSRFQIHDPASALPPELGNVHPDDRVTLAQQVEAALEQHGELNTEFRVLDQQGGVGWRVCRGRVSYDAEGRPARMTGLTIDITFRKLADDVRRNAEERERLRAIIETLTEGIIIANPEGMLLSMNPAALHLYEFESWDEVPDDVRTLEALLGFTDAAGRPLAGAETPFARVLAGEVFTSCEVRVCRKEHGAVWIGSYSGALVRDRNGKAMLAVLTVRDVTGERLAAEEIRKANASLHRLTGELLRLQDEERRRIARELHDGTVQVLTALSMNLLLIGQSTSSGDANIERLIRESHALAKQASRELRTLSYLLHPPDLERLGLASALRSWLDGFGTRTGITMDLELDNPGRLDAETETALFRIAQESLANVQRHSGSTTACVRLKAMGDEVRLEVEDAGRGFPPGTLDSDNSGLPSCGVGILGMRERARQLGGTLHIACNGRGTTVCAVLPRNRKR